LTDIIRKTKKNSIVKCKLEGNRLIINSDNSVFELNALSADEFPKFVPLDPTNAFDLTIPQIKRLFNKTKFAISAEETRYYLNGIYFHTFVNGQKTTLRCVATDGHRLAKTELDLGNTVNIPGIILPRKFILQLDRILGDFEGKVKIICSDTQVSLEADNFIIISKLIDGTFPDYEKVIPVSNDKLLQVEADPFFNAIDRVSTVNQDKAPTVKLQFENNNIKIMATSTDSNKGDEEVAASYAAESLEILFNSKYILDLQDVIEGDTIMLELLNQSSPVIVKDPKDTTSLYILMPMRI
jgi:DNA polymerase-3 subunit beta